MILMMQWEYTHIDVSKYLMILHLLTDLWDNNTPLLTADLITLRVPEELK